jgi:hypothetical protein
MSNKSLADKAIKIQGKDYVLVSDRIIYFNTAFPNGSITTELVSDPESQNVIVKATARPHDEGTEYSRSFTGYSQAVKGAGFINKTAALENAETSAVGRALAMMGIGVIDSVASADEINKAKGTDEKVVTRKQALYNAFIEADIKTFTDQKFFINSVLGKESIETAPEADKVLKALLKEPASQTV